MTAEFTHADRKDGIRKTVLILVAIIAVLVGLFFNRAFTPRILSPVEMVNNGAVIFSTPREISAFNLLDQYSEPFTLERLQDKWTFVFFGVLNALLYIPFVLKGKLTSKRQKIFPLMPTLKQLYSMAITFTLVVITDVFFRSDSVPQALVFFKNIMDKIINTNINGILRNMILLSLKDYNEK